MRRITIFWFFLCAAFIAWWTVLPPPPVWLERVYGGAVYPVIAGVLVPLTGSVQLPVTALLLTALLVWLVLSVALNKNRLRGLRAFWRWLWRGVVTAATLYALFILVWGANYGKTPLETRLGLSAAAPTAAETLTLAEALSRVIRQNRVTSQNWTADSGAGKTSLKELAESLEPHPVTLPRFVKYTPPGFLIFTGRATGITVPWTLEAYIDRALPYPVALATALHEVAHVAGYAGEAEADFIAALAGLSSENASVRYGAALVLFLRVGRALPPERYKALFDGLPPRAKTDLTAYSRAYTRHLAPDFITHVQTRFYDGYLRTQRVGAGIADYDRVVLLLLAARRDGLVTFEPEGVRLDLSKRPTVPGEPG